MFPPHPDLAQEVQRMQGTLSRLEKYIAAQDEKIQKAEEYGFIHERLPNQPMVSKYEAAAILCVSPRHLQRIRKRLVLKWKKVGRETHYFLKELVEAIEKFQCPWNPVAYERAMKRVTRLPRY